MYIESGEGTPVLFVHGNLSDGSAWREQLALLPDGFRGIAPDLRGFGKSDAVPVDATRGTGDFRDDLVALMDQLGLDAVHLVGHSLGGGIVMDLAARHPGRVLSITLVAPVSPYGFGGTRLDGTPCAPDFAGSGGGSFSPEVRRLIEAQDRSGDAPLSPRSIVRTLFFPSAGAVREEDVLVEGILATRTGEDYFPGNAVPSPHWPYTAPGTRGVLNAMSPKYLDWSGFGSAGCAAPVLWVRGDADAVISDASMTDSGNLGALGMIPDWPGAGVFPAQPMIQQTREVLARHGSVREHVMEATGHFPYVQRPAEFASVLHAHLRLYECV